MTAGQIVVIGEAGGGQIAEVLRRPGFKVTEAVNGSALAEAVRPGVDLVVLHCLLPGGKGLEALTEIRKVRPTLPVILIAAQAPNQDWLRLRADDHLPLPVSDRDLVVRVEAILARSRGRPPEILAVRLGHAVIDFERRHIRWSVRRQGEISETETALLRYLVAFRQRPVSRDELFLHLWGINAHGLQTRAIDMHMVRLRTKLRDPTGKSTPPAILTVRSRGYRAGPELVPMECQETGQD